MRVSSADIDVFLGVACMAAGAIESQGAVVLLAIYFPMQTDAVFAIYLHSKHCNLLPKSLE